VIFLENHRQCLVKILELLKVCKVVGVMFSQVVVIVSVLEKNIENYRQ
jgi:hypothetical protein